MDENRAPINLEAAESSAQPSEVDAAKVVQPITSDDGELDPEEYPDDPRAGYQR